MKMTALACVLVGTVIAILSVIAADVSAQDLQGDNWNSGNDPTGAPFLAYPHSEAQIMVLFGYQQSEDCTDVKLIVTNVFDYYPLESATVRGVFGFPYTETEADMPPTEATITTRSGKLFITALYTPSDLFYRELFNAENISWRDQPFPADYNAVIPMDGFNDSFNDMISECILVYTGDPV